MTQSPGSQPAAHLASLVSQMLSGISTDVALFSTLPGSLAFAGLVIFSRLQSIFLLIYPPFCSIPESLRQDNGLAAGVTAPIHRTPSIPFPQLYNLTRFPYKLSLLASYLHHGQRRSQHGQHEASRLAGRYT